MGDGTETPENIELIPTKNRDTERPLSSYDQFWTAVTESIDRLRANPDAWKGYKDEIELLEGSGEVLDEPYFTPEEEEEIRSRVG